MFYFNPMCDVFYHSYIIHLSMTGGLFDRWLDWSRVAHSMSHSLPIRVPAHSTGLVTVGNIIGDVAE